MFQVKQTSHRGLQTRQRVVGNTPTQLTVVNQSCNRGITITNLATAAEDIVYCGDANVSTLTGFPIIPGAELSIPLDNASECYLISAGSVPVSWFAI